MTRAGRAAERLHHRRLHELPHDLRQGGPGDDPRDRGRPLPEPRLSARRPSRPRRAPSSASTTRTAPNPLSKLDRGAARARLHDPHLQAHDDGLPQRHRGHAQPVRLLARRSSTAGTGPEYTTIIVAGDVNPEEVLPLVEKYWGGWKRGQLQGRRSRRSPRRKGPGLRPRALDERRRCPGSPSPSTARRSRRREKDFAALDMLFDLVLRRDLRPLQAPRRARSRRSTSSSPTAPANAGSRRSSTVVRAREEARGRRRTCATRS